MFAPLLAMLVAAAPGASWQPPTEVELGHLLRAYRREPLEVRIAALSARFVGAPFQLGPLGEGPGHAPDPDPIVRWDRVDCVTFVETVLALANAPTLPAAVSTLQRIRYAHGRIDWADRNHLMESEWLPNNARKGFVREVTKDVAGDDVAFLWRDAPPDHRDALPRQIALPLLPVERARDHEAEIAPGTLIFVARDWNRRVPDHVSHVGLCIRKRGKLYVRHASISRGKVVDEPFARFVAEAQREAHFPVLGFELVAPLESGPGARVASSSAR